MGGIKPLIILSMASLYFPIMSGSKGADHLMPDSMQGKMDLKKSRFVPVGCKAVGKFRTIIGLDCFDWARKSFYQMFQKHGRGIGAVFLKSLHKTPSGILINSSILEKVFSGQIGIGKADRRNEFHIDLDALSGALHLLVRLRDVFRVLWVNCHHTLLS